MAGGVAASKTLSAIFFRGDFCDTGEGDAGIAMGDDERGIAGDGIAGDGIAGDGIAGDGIAGDGRAGDGRAGDGIAGDGRAGDGIAGDGRAGDGRAGDGIAAFIIGDFARGIALDLLRDRGAGPVDRGGVFLDGFRAARGVDRAGFRRRLLPAYAGYRILSISSLTSIVTFLS